MAELADALHYAHEKGVIHRDVKAQNIMLDEAGRPHLMDFGLAKREACEITITMDGQILGTPAYMPPEQARGEGNRVDERSDIYSLGVVLYQMITGELPFRGTNPMLLHQVLHDEPRPPRRLNDQIPRDLETICLKAMAKEPHGDTQRPASSPRTCGDFSTAGRSRPGRPAGPSGPGGGAGATALASAPWCRAAAALVAAAVVSVLFGFDRSLRLAESNRHLALVNFELGRAACERGEVGPGLHWLARSLQGRGRRRRPGLTRVARHNLASWQRDIPGLRASSPMAARSSPWRSAPTARPCSPPARIAPAGSGTRASVARRGPCSTRFPLFGTSGPTASVLTTSREARRALGRPDRCLAPRLIGHEGEVLMASSVATARSW